MVRFCILLLFLSIVFSGNAQMECINTVPFTSVHINDNFWSQRLDTLRSKTIRYAFKRSEKSGYIDNFAIAGGLKKGKYQSVYPFDDAEVFKIIEGASYLLMVQKDAGLEAYIDSIVSIIISAQEPDGYLFTNRTISNPLHPWAGTKRWEQDWNLSHETFNAGELYEAAIAYYYATGKDALLNAAIKNADLICSVFNKDGLKMAPGHAVIEMALVRLYEATGNRKYLDQAQFFLDCRGLRKHSDAYDSMRDSGKYWQDHLPAIEQKEAVGHAVRALYFYSGMADIAIHKKNKQYKDAIDSIWNNIVSKKMYITGGLGSTARNEAFGENYELPNATAYCETCASIANCMFNLRMFRLHGNAKYIDVLERSLYNTVLSGISLSGDMFFYPNVLEADKKGQSRSLWFDCSCCPTNLSRFIPAISGYMYATDDTSIYTNLYIGSTANIEVDGQDIILKQTTDYPWEGDVKIEIVDLDTDEFDLKIRIPGWVNSKPVPSDLYNYINGKRDSVQIKINNKIYSYNTESGYAVLKNEWKKGDVINVSFPMNIHCVETNERVVTNRNLVAIERGPLVYCAEFADNDGSVFNLQLDKNSNFYAKKDSNFLNGVYKIYGNGTRYTISSDGNFNSCDTPIVFVPYYTRAYRGDGEMKVWMPENPDVLKNRMYEDYRIIDQVKIGDKRSESEHYLCGENSRFDALSGWRDAENGWFSYNLKICDNKPLELLVTYRTTDGGNRKFEIWADDYLLGVQTLYRETFDTFIDKSFDLPAEILKNKTHITIKFKSLPNNIAGGIYGCKIRLK